MKAKAIAVLFLMVFLASCAELVNVLQTTGSVPLTESDVIAGLKEALVTGARNSAGRLSQENGYFGDAAVKILLPPEASVILDKISSLPGGEDMVNNVVLRINRAAEDAAKEAAPIFVNSITNMTVADAFGILRGTDTDATNYLRKTTYTDLYNLYKPKIASSTAKKIVGNISTIESWEALVSRWNAMANSAPGRIANLKPIDIDLNDYLTNRALSGMFMKIAGEELKIRKDVSARVTPLLQRVFGSIDNTTRQ